MSSQPVAYTIDHQGLRLDIALAPTDRLLIHEETIPERLRSLEASIERDGVQSAPIIVDRGTYVVLDGMHRTAIMKRLGCRFTCVCLVDYFDPTIKVQRWCRVIPASFDARKAEEVLASLDLRLEPFELVKSPDEEGGLLLIYRDQAYRVVSSGEDLVNAFKRSYELESLLRTWGYEVTHCTEAEAQRRVKSGSGEAALYLPKVEKRQVVEVAEHRQVFTPKATRHRLPARPVQVNVPLTLLRDEKLSLEETNRRLAEMLAGKTVTRYDAGTEWMGRKYDEVLYVFEP
ncbi:ParB N-terminal domain-containing protein [Candidatus Bathyarchaeota archaeon]|nr:ParB N-terminal domain-containing protein [Candidatus Bathyarchaeota archaeon]